MGRDTLKAAINDKIAEAVPGSDEKKALFSVKSALDSGQDVSSAALYKAGIDGKELTDMGIFTKANDKGKTVVDFASTGEFAKDAGVHQLMGEKIQAEKVLENAIVHETNKTSALREAEKKFNNPLALKPEPSLPTSGTVLDVGPKGIETLASSEHKGFFGKRIEAVGEALHGGGSWTTRLGLAASAVVLGTASETFAQVMQEANLMSYAIGSDAGGGDIKYSNLSGSMFKNNNNAPTATPITTPAETQPAQTVPAAKTTQQTENIEIQQSASVKPSPTI